MKAQMNLNDPVWVQLTPEGLADYKKVQAEAGCDEPDKNGYYEFSLWELMLKFGKVARPGVSSPFVRNVVHLTPPKS
jgi:hypothetical protein